MAMFYISIENAIVSLAYAGDFWEHIACPGFLLFKGIRSRVAPSVPGQCSRLVAEGIQGETFGVVQTWHERCLVARREHRLCQVGNPQEKRRLCIECAKQKSMDALMRALGSLRVSRYSASMPGQASDMFRGFSALGPPDERDGAPVPGSSARVGPCLARVRASTGALSARWRIAYRFQGLSSNASPVPIACANFA